MSWPPPSTLPDTPFPNGALAAVAAVAEALLIPGYWALDRLLALQPTTAQRARWRRHRAGRCLGLGARVLVAPVLVLALVLALPLSLLGLLLWLPVQAKRRPFVHQHAAAAATPEPWDPRRPRSFTFLTANLCLMPSGLARFSNLGSTRWRAMVIGQRLAPGAPAEGSGHRDGLLEPQRGDGGGYGGTLSTVAWGQPGSGSGPGAPGGDPWTAASPSAPVASTMPWPEMAMANPTPVANPRPAVDSVPTLAVPMTNAAPGAAPSPAATLGPERPVPLANPMPSVLTTRIPPDTDFMCLQEVFDATRGHHPAPAARPPLPARAVGGGPGGAALRAAAGAGQWPGAGQPLPAAGRPLPPLPQRRPRGRAGQQGAAGGTGAVGDGAGSARRGLPGLHPPAGARGRCHHP
ncbi:translation initiation factor IF-2-like isoform X2 [Corvus hawaiiensis]|nr:translation initiation factor IF-2-like isoform X2 [Corvus hawaiiensis]XP_048142274.1 translation initiation factor IF-2-like isoform X2 [Corvus hawaiiensis]XP_048142275.1 translation initiation factor IF-2-like isoform X2 [Corvus hawaiiensis]